MLKVGPNEKLNRPDYVKAGKQSQQQQGWSASKRRVSSLGKQHINPRWVGKAEEEERKTTKQRTEATAASLLHPSSPKSTLSPPNSANSASSSPLSPLNPKVPFSISFSPFLCICFCISYGFLFLSDSAAKDHDANKVSFFYFLPNHSTWLCFIS